MSIKVNDGIASRGRRHINLVVCYYNDKQLVFKFTGVTVPGALTVLKKDYSKNGKWSYNEWEIEPCEGTTILTISQDWETGKWLNSMEWKTAINEFNGKIREPHDGYKKVEPIDSIAVERFIRAEWSNLAKQLDSTNSNSNDLSILKGLLESQELLAQASKEECEIKNVIHGMEEIERNKREAEAIKERVANARKAMSKGASLADLKALMSS